MINKSWSELAHICPIKIDRIESYSKEFESNIPSKITLDNLDSSKEGVLNARSNFDSMVTTLVQTLYDREILKKSEDKILFAWLVDNFGRYMRKLDDDEFNLIVKLDDPGEKSYVGISRISSYSKSLKTSVDSIIYESLLKATNEYHLIKETEKIKKEPRIFLYILFQILQVTLSVLGGLTREKTGLTKRGIVQTIPTSWQSLLGGSGQELIKEGYKEDTGIDVDKFDEDLKGLDEEELEREEIEDESDIESSE